MTGLIAVRVGDHELLVPDTPDDRMHELYTNEHQWYEIDLLAAIRDRQRGGTFVDIGANHGNHSMFFALECAADKVISVEPYRGEYRILAANIVYNQLEQVVEAHRMLIHPSWSSVTLSSATDRPMPETWCYSDQPLLTEDGPTVCARLDDLVAGLEVDVIKIDVEDMSPAVLSTGLGMIDRCRPLVAIEAEPSEQQAIEEMLRSRGYELAGVFCATPTFLWEPGE